MAKLIIVKIAPNGLAFIALHNATVATFNLFLAPVATAKLSKMNLKAGSEEYIKALADQAMQEKKNADNLVESLTKQVEANKVKLASAKEKLDISKKSVEAAKAEFDARYRNLCRMECLGCRSSNDRRLICHVCTGYSYKQFLKIFHTILNCFFGKDYH